MSVNFSCSVVQDQVHVQVLGGTVAYYTGAAFGPLIVGWLTDQYVSCLYIYIYIYIYIWDMTSQLHSTTIFIHHRTGPVHSIY